MLFIFIIEASLLKYLLDRFVFKRAERRVCTIAI
jgi:hypothetical protein